MAGRRDGRLRFGSRMEGTTRADLFDPATLASMGRIEIVARWVVDGFLTGLHRSPRKGFSVEFAEHRPYQPGDDLRYVDWQIAARADRWVVKQFEEETNLRALLVLDVSPSMVWRGAPSRLTKIAYAERLAAALALLLLRQRDAVGLVCFDERVRERLVPARPYDAMEPARGHARAVSARTTDRPPVVQRATHCCTRHASSAARDWSYWSPICSRTSSPSIEPIRSIRAAGHDVVALHILDPAERELAVSGDALFVDPESG